MDKRNIINKLFPANYDFYEMLSNQAEINAFGVDKLHKWLSSGSDEEKQKLLLYKAYIKKIMVFYSCSYNDE